VERARFDSSSSKRWGFLKENKMGLTILICISIIVIAIVIDVVVENNSYDHSFGALSICGGFVAIIVLISMFTFSRDDIKKEDWKIIEQYEITYKANFEKSPVFVEFIGNNLTVFVKDSNDNITPIKDFKIVSKGEVAEYIKKTRKTEETFSKWGNIQTEVEVVIPIKILEKWMEKK
jgi:hypothetical protein